MIVQCMWVGVGVNYHFLFSLFLDTTFFQIALGSYADILIFLAIEICLLAWSLFLHPLFKVRFSNFKVEWSQKSDIVKIIIQLFYFINLFKFNWYLIMKYITLCSFFFQLWVYLHPKVPKLVDGLFILFYLFYLVGGLLVTLYTVIAAISLPRLIIMVSGVEQVIYIVE